MRHRKHTFKIGRKPAHRSALLANQVCSLIQEGRIETTVVKAKETKRLAEKMVTLGKRGQLAQRRKAIAVLHQVDAVKKLFETIAPKYSARPGGFCRIIKLGLRVGDAAQTCYLEWVESEVVAKAPRRGGASKPVTLDAAAAPAEAAAPAAEAPKADDAAK